MSHPATKYAEAEFEKMWASAKTDRDNSVTVATVFHIAKQNGWVAPRSTVEGAEDAKDILNGKRYANMYRDRMLFISETDDVLLATAEGWVHAPIGEEITAAKEVVVSFNRRADEIFKQNPKDPGIQTLRKHANYSSTLPRLQAMVVLSKCEPGKPERGVNPQWKPLETQILELMDRTPPAQLDREWTTEELVRICHGRTRDSPTGGAVGNALRALGWVHYRDETLAGQRRRVWRPPEPQFAPKLYK